QQAAKLAQSVEALQKAKDAELAKVKEDAALDAARIRKEATEAAEALFQEQLALNEGRVATANAKVLEAEAKLATLAEQHAKAMAEQLNAQREVLEKAKEDALNAERAKAFDENQKISKTITNLHRALVEIKRDELWGESVS